MKKKVLGIVGSLELELEGRDDTAILILSGQIDSYTAEEITKIIESHISQGNLKIIVDLAKVDYLDSAGLSALISCKIKLSKRNGALKLVGLAGKAKDVFEITGMTQMFEIFETREDAFKSLS